MTTKHLTFFTGSMNGGGAERVLLELAGGFTARGFDCHLALLFKEGVYLDQISPDVTLMQIGSNHTPKPYHLLHKITYCLRLASYLRRHQPPVMLCTLRSANMMALMAKKLARVNTKIIIREACVISEDLAQFTPFQQWLTRLKFRLTYPLADGVIVMSERMAEDVVKIAGVAAKKCHIIANPAVTPQLLEQAKEHVDHPWFQEGTTPVIVAAGRLNHQKGFDLLLEAFAQLRKSMPCHLWIMGEGPDHAALEKQANVLGISEDVIFAGFVTNPFAYMSKAQLFVLPSRFEGMPNTLIQAMACGCPVVATDCPSGPKEIINNPVLGTLVPVDDAEALCKAMQQPLQTPTDTQPLRNRAEAFHIDRIIGLYAEVLGVTLENRERQAS